ncbi:MAG: D-glucuronyl C5-epimerase family protein [Solirubrobacteraceae bacterium]
MRASHIAWLLLGLSLSGLAGPPASPAAALGSQRLARSGPHRLLVLTTDGRTYLRSDRYLPPPDAPAASARLTQREPDARLAHVSASHGPSVTSALASLRRSGAISSASYQTYSSEYQSAQRTLKKLHGTRYTELAAVIANVQALAASDEFITSRLPALFLTLQNNRRWWSTGPLLSYGQRVSFPGSRIVWESYPGQGIEIQWLATFGEANGYFLAGNENTAFTQLLGEIIPLGTQRAGGIAWEYFFQFDGGRPPWTSGLSQGTALQALSRGWQRFKTAAYLETAKAALGIFNTRPPAGVRVPTAAGAHYLEYTYAPSELIVNGEIQAVIGLYDYTKLTGDPLGSSLFEAGDAQARLDVPHYNTGAWSMYDQHSESALNYHELLTEFLKNLCQRTGQGPPLPAATPPPTTTTTTTPTTPVGPSGGSAPTASSSAAHSSSTTTTTTTKPSAAISGDEIYCSTAEEFTEDLHTPPEISLLSRTLSTNSRAGVQFSLSKVAKVSVSIRWSGKTVWSNSATVEGGKPKILWVTPKKGGTYTVSASATDLAGNSASTTGTITLKGARK